MIFKKKYSLLLLFQAILFQDNLIGQTLDTNAINRSVYSADTRIQVHELKNYTSFFVDSSNKLPVQDIVADRFNNRFRPLPDSMRSESYISYWVKFSISVSGDISKWWLILDPYHGYIDAWFLDSANQINDHQRSGSFVPHSQKSITENPSLNRIYFSAKAGEVKTVYLRIYNEFDGSPDITSPQLRNPVIGLEDNRFDIKIVICVIVFVFSILSFFFYFFVKEKAYLLFGIYTLFLAHHYLIIQDNLPFVDWYIPEYPHQVLPIFLFLTIGGLIVFALFGRSFINLPQLSRRLDRIFNWVVGVWSIFLVTVIIMMAVTRRGGLVEANFIFVILFIVFLIRIAFFKSTLVRIYVAGALWLICFSILGYFEVSTPYLNAFPIGQIGQLMIYGAGLGYKVRMNEKAKAEAEIITLRNVELARLYEERTKQKEEIEVQKKNAEEALVELKATQAQLIQSEKMASLGELTAGIAHEIQNPLNFVNNFSEVSNELIVEMVDEVDKGNTTEVKAIAEDLKQNLEKIIHHGKRADAIVKGMLQHSRSSSAIKEPTDINKLTDEYLRLAYHGFRAKDKTFNATMKTDYDDTIGHINIIPQDIGRAILNLITNAFHAVGEKARSGIENYEPTVSVSTKKINGKVEVRVRDNGNGISLNVLEKIFQPFFTTKPTGQGTGLGLSLAYDIVKAHGGELKVETKDAEGSEFVILLPLQT